MNTSGRFTPSLRLLHRALLLGLIVPTLAGCAALGLATRALPARTLPPKYTNLRGQTVAVMAWVTPGARIDWPQLRLDVGNSVQQQLQKAGKDKVRELEGTTFPLSAAMVAQMQDDHAEWAGDGAEDIAPRLGVSRLVYIEVENFQTRSDASTELFRGNIGGRVKVVEVTNGKARVVLSEDNLRAVFPKKGPEEGEPNKNDYDIYRETVKAFTTNIVNLFIPHKEEEE